MKSPKRFGAMVAETGEGKTNKLSQRSIDLGKTLLDYIRKDVNKKDEIKRVYENRNSLSGWELSMENSVGHESSIKDLVVYGCTTAGDGLKTIQGEMGVYLRDMSCSITKDSNPTRYKTLDTTLKKVYRLGLLLTSVLQKWLSSRRCACILVICDDDSAFACSHQSNDSIEVS